MNLLEIMKPVKRIHSNTSEIDIRHLKNYIEENSQITEFVMNPEL